MSSKNRVVIVGGGFAGVKAALDLADDPGIDITLVSDHSHFRYYPTLYRAATGGKRAGARIRLNDIVDHRPIKFVRATATRLDRAKKELHTKEGKVLAYDTLVLALGNITNYFGIEGLEKYSFSIKSSEEVERFKQHLHSQLIKNGCPDPNYAIVGGGPTGIELAGALPGYLREITRKHGIQECKINITLVEAAPRLLPRSPAKVSREVTRRLRRLGITLKLGTAVEGQTANMLMLDGKDLASQTVVWTAGVAINPFFARNNFAMTERHKVQVDEYLQAEPDIFVLGDNADTPYSGMAQTALHDGQTAARNIRLIAQSRMPEEYVPKKPITVIPVGPGWASVEWGSHIFSGWIGSLLRTIADYRGFSDIESWPRASKQWMLAMTDEDLDCPHCGSRKV